MTTETLSNTLLSKEMLEPTASPRGLWGQVRSILQTFRTATELSTILQVLPPEEQADFARRYLQERS